MAQIEPQLNFISSRTGHTRPIVIDKLNRTSRKNGQPKRVKSQASAKLGEGLSTNSRVGPQLTARRS